VIYLKEKLFTDNFVSTNTCHELSRIEGVVIKIVVIALRLEIPSGIWAKLRTAAASNNRVHMSWSLFAHAIVTFNRWHYKYHQRLHVTITLLFLVPATYIYFCSSRIFRSWWMMQSTQHHRRGCNNSCVHPRVMTTIISGDISSCTFSLLKLFYSRKVQMQPNPIVPRPLEATITACADS